MFLLHDMSDLEIEVCLACMATLFCANAVWMGRWVEDREVLEKAGAGNYLEPGTTTSWCGV